MAKKQKTLVKEAGSDEFVAQEQVVTEAAEKAEKVVETKKVAVKPGDQLVTIELPVGIKINGVRYIGRVTVPQKVADVLAHMAFKKQKSDLRVFTGKAYNVSRLLDNTLVIKEGEIK